ncbi:hypothetical protein STP2_022 [Streptococcus phage STP2]|nr:hypothetical protein STP2_022 [Streptococcus phage STP2]
MAFVPIVIQYLKFLKNKEEKSKKENLFFVPKLALWKNTEKLKLLFLKFL